MVQLVYPDLYTYLHKSGGLFTLVEEIASSVQLYVWKGYISLSENYDYHYHQKVHRGPIGIPNLYKKSA